MTGTTNTEDKAALPANALENFAARVAHDFNNLLTGILGNLELLQLRAQRNKLHELDGYLQGANSAGGRAAAFAARLMTFSGYSGSTPSQVRVDEVLANFAANATCRLTAGTATLLCDPAQLELAIAELLANAAEAGGESTLSSAVENSHIIITISDTGHGMDPATLARAAEPFFTTAPNGTGRGLGLAITARIIKDMRGTMHITAQPQAGCTVTLQLPSGG